jgi:hypothetical protein
MDDLLAGTLFSLCMEFSMPRYCPALLRPSLVHLWKTFRSKPNTIPVDEQNCSPSHRNGVRLQNGMLFGFTPEWCSPSDRNRVRLRPDSPSWNRNDIEFDFDFVFNLNGSARDADGTYAEVALFERCGTTIVSRLERNHHNNRLTHSVQV